MRLTELHVCDGCNRPFVVPLTVVDLIDHERCVVELHCTNCGRTALGVHDDASLEELDRELDETQAAMRESLELLTFLDEVERIDRFADALHRDLVLVEDF